jgi:hypothetical protein
MSRYISEAFRRFIALRAQYRCEYCRISDADAFFPFHIDHIISLKHGGKTVLTNLAYSCQICNLNKGSDVATFLSDIQTPIRFYNPRIDVWQEHFDVADTGLISPKSDIGEATIKIFNTNQPDSVIERREMIRLNLF